MSILEIYNENCLDRMRKIKDKTIDIVITSPPYNLNIKYKGDYNDNKPEQEYLKFIKIVCIEIKRILKDDGHFFLNVGYTNKNPLVDINIAMELKDLFKMQNRISWIKSISIEMKLNDKKNMKKEEDIVSYGHIKPINSQRYIAPAHEPIFHYTKTGNAKIDKLKIGVPYKYKCNLNERNKKKNKTGKKNDCRDRGNCWFIPYETINSRKKDRKDHPATYPKKLVEMCIKSSGILERENPIILDPFLGSGTTCMVAFDMGIKSIGIELSKNYYNSIKEDFKNKNLKIIEKEKEFFITDKKNELFKNSKIDD